MKNNRLTTKNKVRKFAFSTLTAAMLMAGISQSVATTSFADIVDASTQTYSTNPSVKEGEVISNNSNPEVVSVPSTIPAKTGNPKSPTITPATSGVSTEGKKIEEINDEVESNIKSNVKELLEAKKLSPENIEKEKEAALRKAKLQAIAHKILIRVAGKDKVETSVAASVRQFNFSSKVIIVNEDSPSSALVASVLAHAKDVPVLLTNSDSIPDATLHELTRLKTTDALFIGNEGDFSPSLDNKLKDLKINVEKIIGKDKYDTSAKVAERVYNTLGDTRSAVVVSGENISDALSAAPLAIKKSAPLLLVKKNEITPEIQDVILFKSLKKVYVVGGSNSIQGSVISQLPNIKGIFAGKNRYETSAKVASSVFNKSDVVFVASGENFSDALSIAPLSGYSSAPIILVKENSFSPSIKSYVEESDSLIMVYAGGIKSISEDVKSDLAEMPEPEEEDAPPVEEAETESVGTQTDDGSINATDKSKTDDGSINATDKSKSEDSSINTTGKSKPSDKSDKKEINTSSPEINKKPKTSDSAVGNDTI